MIFENIALALNAIRVNKMRSFLTMLGIIIGISSVIAITSIGSSVQGVVDKQFESFGRNAMYIYPNWSMIDDYFPMEAFFDEDEMMAVKERFSNEIAYIDPYAVTSSDITAGRREGRINLTGAAAELDKHQNLNIIYGRFINDSDVNARRTVTVIDAKAAQELFGTDNAVGRTVTMSIEAETQEYTVVGIFKEEESIFTGMNMTYTGYVPYSLIRDQVDYINWFYLFIADGLDPEETGEMITNYLARMKGQPEGFYRYESSAMQQDMMNSTLGMLSTGIGIIAGISLLVGGIGIMNIMLVSVTERTREIGIRKSLGARTHDILFQFLIESMIISAIGGLLGTSFGVGIAALGMGAVGVDFSMNPMVIVIAVIFSAIVGMFFGIYPARKAARLDPIEALRYE